MQYTTGLVLSGGGARGIAHIGVLKAMEEAGWSVDILAGSSAGAIIGALYASGCSADDIFDLIRNKSLYSIVKMGIPDKGMMELGYFRDVLLKQIPHDRFEDLKIPLYVAVTNLNKGGCEIIHSGSHLIDYVLASAAIPLVFKPISIHGSLYVDGGLINNLPVEPLKSKCQRLIGVNVNTIDYIGHVNGIKNVGMRCLDISLHEHVQTRLKQCDIIIEPLVSQFAIFDLNKSVEIYKAGYDAAKSAIFTYQNTENHGTSASR